MLQAFHQFESIHLRHLDVQKKQVEMTSLQDAICLVAIARCDDLGAWGEPFKRQSREHDIDVQVVDKQNSFHLLFHSFFDAVEARAALLLR